MYTIQRQPSTPEGTFGQWFGDGEQLCVTVERPDTGDHPCVAPGNYHFKQFNSPSKGDVWLMTNPPEGRSMIEVHPANLASELLGCIAPGDTYGMIDGVRAVMNSKNTFSMLKSKLPDEFDLTIIGAQI